MNAGDDRAAPGPPGKGGALGVGPEIQETWTGGAAKWAAVLVLSLATLGVALYTSFWRVPPARLERGGDGAGGTRGAAGTSDSTGEQGRLDPRLDLNRASVEAIEQLPGVGAGLALAIVRDREAHGAFKSVDDLDRVPGVGPATLKAVRAYVRVDEP